MSLELLRDHGGSLAAGWRHELNPAQLEAVTHPGGPLLIIAGAGTGKTTTLIQVADAMHAFGRAAALFIPLGEWSSQDRDFLASVLARPVRARS